MSIVLAALDTTAAARPVLETAVRIGELIGAEVEVVHVHGGPRDSIETAESLSARAGVRFRLLEGPVESALLGAISAPDVLAAVIGARSTTGGRRPVGRTALHILQHADKPVVVVPPEAVAPIAFRRLLVPLDGTEVSSRPVLEWLWPLLATDAELVVLHVFTDRTLPAMLDRPVRDTEMLGREFLTYHLPHAAHIEFRPGPVAARVAEVSREHAADLIVLSWSQDSSGGRAGVVREVLGAAACPVLLLPVQRPDSDDATPARAGDGKGRA
jgi:nucleotide-binding universal stress UspA family protein